MSACVCVFRYSQSETTISDCMCMYVCLWVYVFVYVRVCVCLCDVIGMYMCGCHKRVCKIDMLFHPLPSPLKKWIKIVLKVWNNFKLYRIKFICLNSHNVCRLQAVISSGSKFHYSLSSSIRKEIDESTIILYHSSVSSNHHIFLSPS